MSSCAVAGVGVFGFQSRRQTHRASSGCLVHSTSREADSSLPLQPPAGEEERAREVQTNIPSVLLPCGRQTERSTPSFYTSGRISARSPRLSLSLCMWKEGALGKRTSALQHSTRPAECQADTTIWGSPEGLSGGRGLRGVLFFLPSPICLCFLLSFSTKKEIQTDWEKVVFTNGLPSVRLNLPWRRFSGERRTKERRDCQLLPALSGAPQAFVGLFPVLFPRGEERETTAPEEEEENVRRR